MDPILGMIFSFAGNFAPSGYAFCNGQLLNISSNAALFSLVGTYYGGNGQTTFALPDLRGRTCIGTGQGAGLTAFTIGEDVGAETATIGIANLPNHNHPLNVSSAAGNTAISGTTSILAKGPSTGSGPNATFENIYTTATPDTTLAANAVGYTGANSPIAIRQPSLAISYVIALQGVFPSRN